MPFFVQEYVLMRQLCEAEIHAISYFEKSSNKISWNIKSQNNTMILDKWSLKLLYNMEYYFKKIILWWLFEGFF